MGFNLNGGSLYMFGHDGESVLLGENVSGVAEVEMSADEVAPILYNLNSNQSQSFEMECENLDLLNLSCDNAVPTKGFTIEYERPIIIQARWHKKARVRKKWLKRFGMKPDIVKIITEASAITYDTHIEEFEFETNYLKYIWRPDQKRKGLKIEW